MKPSIQCLMTAGAPLDKGIGTALYLAACSLIRSRKSYVRFTDENGSGGVSTEHKRRFVSSGMGGIEFTAIVDFGSRTTKCRFLVNDVNMPTEEEVLTEFDWIWDESPPPDFRLQDL